MKKLMHYLSLLLIATIIVCLSACGDDKEKDEPNEGNTPQELIVGTWVCTTDAYGQRFDAPLQVVFKDDNTGYSWWQDDPFSKRDRFTYSISKTEITLRFVDDSEFVDTVYLEYELSKDGRSVTVYGFDDNDMSILKFTKNDKGQDQPDTPSDLALAEQLMASKWEMVDDGDGGDMVAGGSIITFEKSGFMDVIPHPGDIEHLKWEVKGKDNLIITVDLGYDEEEGLEEIDQLIGTVKFVGERCIFDYKYWEGDHWDGEMTMILKKVK